MAEEIDLLQRIRDFEGLELKPYRCTKKVLTIGYGHNLEEGITKEMAEAIFSMDLIRCLEDLERNKLVFGDAPQEIRAVLLDMCFNIGINRLLGFKKMLQALKEEDYNKAADELLDSKYATQVKRRAEANASLLRSIAKK